MSITKTLKEVGKSSVKGAESYFFWVFNVAGSIAMGLYFLSIAFLPSTYEATTNPILAISILAICGLFLLWWGTRNFRGWKNKKKCWPYDWRNR